LIGIDIKRLILKVYKKAINKVAFIAFCKYIYLLIYLKNGTLGSPLG